MPIGAVDGRYNAYRYSTTAPVEHEKHHFLCSA